MLDDHQALDCEGLLPHSYPRLVLDVPSEFVHCLGQRKYCGCGSMANH